jgi:hypothetical protein
MPMPLRPSYFHLFWASVILYIITLIIPWVGSHWNRSNKELQALHGKNLPAVKLDCLEGITNSFSIA